MESDKVVVIKRGPRRVGLKRTSIQGKATLATNDSAAGESEPPDSAIEELADATALDQAPNGSLTKDTELSVSATNEAGLSEPVPMETEPSEIKSDVADNTKKELVSDSVKEDVPLESSDSTDLKIVPNAESSSENTDMVVADSDATKLVKEETKENDNLSSEDSEEFLGFQSVPSPTTKPIFKKLIANAQSEIDQEDTKLVTDGIRAMYGDDEESAIQAAIVARTKEPRMGNGVGRKKKREADGSFDNMKLLSEVSSEVTSSNDVSNNANDSYKTNEDVPSEVTSSATNSPSMAGAAKSPASAARPKRAARATKSSVDISDPIFRKPFEYGWKRELVYRNSNDSSTKVQADIYYYAPSGKKVRSTREIVEHLYGSDLTLENFTFFKEPVGIEDTEKEIIRIAKRVSVGGSAVTTPKRLSTPKTPKAAKDPLALPTKVSPDSPEKAGTSKLASRGFPRIKITQSQLLRGSPGTSKGKGRGRKAQLADSDDMEIGMLPPAWSQPLSKVKVPPCSLRCLGVVGQVPSLQCLLCLCLYHAECVGLGGSAGGLHSYVCKNCQQEKKRQIPPPPLTPISMMGLGVKNESTGIHKSPPRLQRIPRPGEVAKFVTVPRFVKIPSTNAHPPMVGGVTTWLPPSSTIQMTNVTTNPTISTTAACTELSPAKNLQTVANLYGKRYIVVSKHNVVSVSNPSSPSSAVEANPAHVQGDEEVQTLGAGGPILPKPYVLSGGHQNPPGVLLVPWVASNSPAPVVQPATAAANQPQFYLVNGNLVLSSTVPEQEAATPAEGDASAPAVAAPVAKKRKREAEVVEAPVVAPKRPKKVAEEPPVAVAAPPAAVATNMSYPSMIALGYTAMVNVFQYLKVKELARAARVCRMWRDLADHPSLWRVVRMKNSQVDDWEGFVTSLVRNGTQQLDLRKMLLPTEQADIDNLWRAFLKEISRATCLVRVDLCRCPAFVVEELPAACPGLAVLNAVAIKCSTINLESLANFTNLQELRLKSMTGCHLASNMDAFKSMPTLKHLSLTTFKDLGQAGPEVIGLLINLESLEIGECSDLDGDFSTKVLSKLTKLSSLRLEKGQGKTCPTFSLLDGVKDLPALTQLELVNFDIKAGFSEALAQCTNIKRLLIIPTYVTQSATTNHMVLSAVTELKDSLSHLVWGVTNELLRVTELFIDQCDTAKEGGNRVKAPKIPKSPDSIPIMKPEKCKNDWDSSDSKSMSSPIGQVKILTLSKLQQVLVTQLPNTKIKILKVPFQSTWRQSISEPMV